MSEREELLSMAIEVRDSPEMHALVRLIKAEIDEARWWDLSGWDTARVLAHRLKNAGHVKP